VSISRSARSVIKSIQAGTTTIGDGGVTNTTAITAVTMGKALITTRDIGDGSGGTNGGHVELTNATTVTYVRSTSSGISTAHWTVTEFY
jgi:hypothetical protein